MTNAPDVATGAARGVERVFAIPAFVEAGTWAGCWASRSSCGGPDHPLLHPHAGSTDPRQPQSKWVSNGVGRTVARGADLGDPVSQMATAEGYGSLANFLEQAANATGGGAVMKGVGAGVKTAAGAAKFAAGASAATKAAPLTLTSVGKSMWPSLAGLIYGPGSQHKHRLTHGHLTGRMSCAVRLSRGQVPERVDCGRPALIG